MPQPLTFTTPMHCPMDDGDTLMTSDRRSWARVSTTPCLRACEPCESPAKSSSTPSAARQSSTQHHHRSHRRWRTPIASKNGCPNRPRAAVSQLCPPLSGREALERSRDLPNIFTPHLLLLPHQLSFCDSSLLHLLLFNNPPLPPFPHSRTIFLSPPTKTSSTCLHLPPIPSNDPEPYLRLPAPTLSHQRPARLEPSWSSGFALGSMP